VLDLITFEAQRNRVPVELVGGFEDKGEKHNAFEV
jgi:hypothetical protein